MKNLMKAWMLAATLGAFAAVAAPPVKTESFPQAEDLTVTITYKLTNGPAVVTLGARDAVTDEPITDAAFSCVFGDVNKQVSSASEDEIHTIVWDPAHAAARLGTDVKNIKPVLTAWPLDDTPYYMVVDLAESSRQRVRYYVSTNSLPGGLFDNVAYRSTLLVLRKIPAKGVTWTMGSENEPGRNVDAAPGTDPEEKHTVTFDNNYYMAVFPTTQVQWWIIKGTAHGGTFANLSARNLRPMETTSYCEIRENSGNTPNTACEYPHAPHGDSFIGRLRSRTGLQAFDLPSDAEWEYASRAGWGDNKWGNGTALTAAVPGRYYSNQASTSYDYATVGPESGTAIVGSYAPNDWGLYDMHGNVFEWCLDWYTADITGLNGAVNTASGTSGVYMNVTAKHRVRRGGAWNLPVKYLRSACRLAEPGNSRGTQNGFRVKLGEAKNAE